MTQEDESERALHPFGQKEVGLFIWTLPALPGQMTSFCFLTISYSQTLKKKKKNCLATVPVVYDATLMYCLSDDELKQNTE